MKHYLFTDNFYTRHKLAYIILCSTEYETVSIGTVRSNFVDKEFKKDVEQAMLILCSQKRGSWTLVTVPSATSDRVDYRVVSAEHEGYIIWKDRNPVIFYTNDLTIQPSKSILMGMDAEAVESVHGLGPVHHWTGTEIFHRTVFQVPAPIVTYNIYMNSVDIMDQHRKVVPMQHKEKRIYMSVFTLLLDLAVHNAYALYCCLYDRNIIDTKRSKKRIRKISFSEFKCSIYEELVGPLHKVNTEKPVYNKSRQHKNSGHYLVLCEEDMQLRCSHCKLVDKTIRVCSNYGCSKCNLGFCVLCFTIYHSDDTLVASMDDLLANDTNRSRLRKFQSVELMKKLHKSTLQAKKNNRKRRKCGNQEMEVDNTVVADEEDRDTVVAV